MSRAGSRFSRRQLYEYDHQPHLVLQRLYHQEQPELRQFCQSGVGEMRAVENRWHGAQVLGASFSGSDLSGGEFSGFDWRAADVTQCDLSNAELGELDLRTTDLQGVKMDSHQAAQLLERLGIAIIG